MATATRFEELEVWQTARGIVKQIYALSKEGAFARDYALQDQMRRAAISILSNIAEGFESRTQVMFIEYLGRAKASAGELRAQSYVVQDNGYTDSVIVEQLRSEIEKCSRQISRLITYLESQKGNLHAREDGIAYEIESQ